MDCKKLVKKNGKAFAKKGGKMNKTIKAYIYRGEKYYIGECAEISVVTQGKTVDETIVNLKEAVNLHLEGENLEELGLSPQPNLLIIMEEEVSVA